jgi:hypothetical protein
MSRYPKCGKYFKASGLRAHVGVHMSTDPNLGLKHDEARGQLHFFTFFIGGNGNVWFLCIALPSETAMGKPSHTAVSMAVG